MQETRVQSLVRQLRSCIPPGMAKKKKKSKIKIYLSKDMVSEAEWADRRVRSYCPGFLWKVSNEGHTNEGAEYSLGKEEFGGCIFWFLSQLHLPKGRRDFCPYLALFRSVVVTKSKLALLATQQANESERLLRQSPQFNCGTGRLRRWQASK